MAGMSTALTTTGGGYTGLSSSSYASTYQSYNWGSYNIPTRNYGYSNDYWAVPREERKKKKKEKTKELSKTVERRQKKKRTRALSEEPPVASSSSSSSAAAGSSSPPPPTGAVQSTSVWALFSSIWRRVSVRSAANADSSVEKPEQQDFKLQSISADEHSSGRKPEPDDDDDDGLKLLHINSDDEYSSAEEPQLDDDDDEYFSAEEPEVEKDPDLQKLHSISDEEQPNEPDSLYSTSKSDLSDAKEKGEHPTPGPRPLPFSLEILPDLQDSEPESDKQESAQDQEQEDHQLLDALDLQRPRSVLYDEKKKRGLLEALDLQAPQSGLKYKREVSIRSMSNNNRDDFDRGDAKGKGEHPTPGPCPLLFSLVILPNLQQQDSEPEGDKQRSVQEKEPEEHKLIEHSDQKSCDTDSDDQWRTLIRRRRDISLGITSTSVPDPSEEGTDLLEALDLHGYESRSEKRMEAQSRRRRDISRRIIGNWKDGLDQDEVKGLQNYVGYLKKKYGNILSEKSSVESIILGETEFNPFSDPLYVQSMLSSSYDLLFLKL